MKHILLLFAALTLSLSAFADNDKMYNDLVNRLDNIEVSTDTLQVSIVGYDVFVFDDAGNVIYAEIPHTDPLTSSGLLGYIFLFICMVLVSPFFFIGIVTVFD